MKKINTELKKYIEENIFPEYNKNESGHGIEHIKYVINRSLKFAVEVDNIDYDMVYTIAAYHDIAHHIDAKHHEELGAKILIEDNNLRKFFTEDEIKTMSEAVYDHRASLEGEPRSVYGKIVSSADRNTSVDVPLKRTYSYRVEHNPRDTLDKIIEESRRHIIDKFGKKGYATEKMYFEDLDYKKFLEDISVLAENKVEFRRRFMEVNGLNNKLKLNFDEIKRQNPTMSLDEVLYAVYDKVKDEYNKPFDVLRNMILEANGINELQYYTKNVRQDLKDYITEHIFPEYDKNDGGHNIAHILEVIRRSFALNDTFKLGLDDNMMYAIASCHDWGKYIDHATHHLIAAKNFMNDEGMKQFFTDEERKIIKEAIEDHRSSKEDEPRSVYGKLISSADRNTRIEIVFIRSFFVAHERMPETNIEEYLDYTIQRLSKKYDEDNPENMFFEDKTYKVFIQDMRNLLKREEEFKNRYCEVNHISSRNNKVQDEQGEISYTKVLKRKI
ncbi:MAG: HD domain-containing protein [Bacilli bacterium]|nr:HD domain-containing protein [Bacilli bacterium]MBO6194782.1 HD domain-containing protein [Bacilli bacterium]